MSTTLTLPRELAMSRDRALALAGEAQGAESITCECITAVLAAAWEDSVTGSNTVVSDLLAVLLQSGPGVLGGDEASMVEDLLERGEPDPDDFFEALVTWLREPSFAWCPPCAPLGALPAAHLARQVLGTTG